MTREENANMTLADWRRKLRAELRDSSPELVKAALMSYINDPPDSAHQIACLGDTIVRAEALGGIDLDLIDECRTLRDDG